jgi:hypothetical protein
MPQGVEERFIDEAQRRLGVRFPESYRRAIAAANGGEVCVADETWDLHPVRDTSDARRRRKTCDDVLNETAQAREWRGFPDGAVAIGGNGFGDRLIFLPPETADPDASPVTLGPEVCVWWHDTGETKVVASDFSELAE